MLANDNKQDQYVMFVKYYRVHVSDTSLQMTTNKINMLDMFVKRYSVQFLKPSFVVFILTLSRVLSKHASLLGEPHNLIFNSVLKNFFNTFPILIEQYTEPNTLHKFMGLKTRYLNCTNSTIYHHTFYKWLHNLFLTKI